MYNSLFACDRIWQLDANVGADSNIKNIHTLRTIENTGADFEVVRLNCPTLFEISAVKFGRNRAAVNFKKVACIDKTLRI